MMLNLRSDMEVIPNEVDIIVVGGGAAGCVLAGRLARSFSALQVLIIEAGKNNRDDPLVRTPAFYIHHLKPDSQTANFHISKPSPHVAGRSNIVASGGVLGGGSSINFMMYTRASASDYDDWNTEGWTFKDLKPLLVQTETYHVQPNDPNHGYDGPLHVSYGDCDYKIADDYIEAAKRIGIESTTDVNDFRTVNKTARWPKWINPNTSKRSDAAHGFVHSVRDEQDNLHLLTESKVVRIVFERTRAVGVEYMTNATTDQAPKTIKARKFVVISAGALSTPQILQRSGIGDVAKLKALNIDSVSHLPGVGQNYQDHQLLGKAGYRVETPLDDTIGTVLCSSRETLAQLESSGSFARNFVDTGIKLRPTDDEVLKMGPAFHELWKEYFVSKPDKPVMYVGVFSTWFGDPTGVPEGSYIMNAQYLEYPASRGTIHITSKDVYKAADFDAGFLSHPADLSPQVWAYKRNREIIRGMSCFRSEYGPSHPSFPIGSAATCNAKDPLKYTKEDDTAIEDWVRQGVETTWHSIGTCAMKSRAEGGVVDKDLNVHGTQNLKIADLSICPGNVGSNTYSTALLIGEKAAVIVARELISA